MLSPKRLPNKSQRVEEKMCSLNLQPQASITVVRTNIWAYASIFFHIYAQTSATDALCLQPIYLLESQSSSGSASRPNLWGNPHGFR